MIYVLLERMKKMKIDTFKSLFAPITSKERDARTIQCIVWSGPSEGDIMNFNGTAWNINPTQAEHEIRRQQERYENIQRWIDDQFHRAMVPNPMFCSHKPHSVV